MDSQITSEGRLVDIVDENWREDELPNDDITVPCSELPDPEADNGDTHLTLKEQEQKWTDIGLMNILNEQHHQN
ncbi:anaphase-promoting complex subunit 13 [Chrysoperla carnea]|uniref:anaphase-promoting complex subunit 13 n=1 Tax=Chrysoperla carnea TaxID=189513 RepID=UPI001D06F97C|nr:anaphase-promoting complex subunit 13 [Chrysoperla carnea]